MIQLKRKQTYAIAAIAIGIMLAFIVPAVNRIGKPKFEGKTAEEWLDYAESELVRLEEHKSSPGGNFHEFKIFHELTMKELTVALTACGEDTQRNLIRDFLYFKSPSGFKAKLNNLNNKLPPSVRITAFWDPLRRRYLITNAIRKLKPSWSLVEPFVEPISQKGDREEIKQLTDLLGHVGDGATNGVPFLLQVRTNGFSGLALQSLRVLNITAAPSVVPALVEDISAGRVTENHLQILRAHGQKAAEAIPYLESLLGSPPNRINSTHIAHVILSIDLNNQEALNHLDNYHAHNDWGPKPSRFYRDEALAKQKNLADRKNPDKSGLYEKLYELDNTTDSEILKGRASYTASTIRDRASMIASTIGILLSSDPYDEVALKFLNKYLSTEPISFFTLIEYYCYSDSPGVLDALEKLEKNTADKQVLDSIQITSRHIELNDKLRELKKNTH